MEERIKRLEEYNDVLWDENVNLKMMVYKLQDQVESLKEKVKEYEMELNIFQP
jgi:hypothetical protein